MARTSYFTGFPLNQNQSVYVEDLLRQFGERVLEVDQAVTDTASYRDQAQDAATEANSSKNQVLTAAQEVIDAKDSAQNAATAAEQAQHMTELSLQEAEEALQEVGVALSTAEQALQVVQQTHDELEESVTTAVGAASSASISANAAAQSEQDIAALTTGFTGSYDLYRFTAVGGETALSGQDDDAKILGYSPDSVVIFLNGQKLTSGEDYSAVDGSSITGLSPLVAGDIVEVQAFNLFSVIDAARRSNNLADLPDLKEARSNLGTFSTVADVQSSHIPAALDNISLFDGKGPALHLTRGSNVDGAIQDAAGQWWEDVGYNTITVRIPTDFDSLQSAVDFYSRLPIRNGAVIRLLIESGHKLTKGLHVQHGDYSKFVIESEDSVVELDAGFEPTFDPDGDGNILRVTAAAGPKLACVIDMDHRFGNAAYFTEGSRGHIENECGIINAGSHGLVVVSSQVDAHRSIWNGAKRSGIRATQASTVGAQGAKANDCASEAGSEGSFYCSRGSTLTVMLGEAKNSGSSAIQCHRSYINAQGVDVSNPAEHAVLAQIYARVNINSAIMEGCGGVPIVIRNGMCKVNAWNSTISSVSSGPILQINTDGGAEVNLTGVTTPNSPVAGTPADDDIPNYMLYNQPTSRGIVWDGNRGSFRIAQQAFQRGNIDAASSTEIFYNQFSGGSPSGTTNTAYFHIELPGDMGHQLAFRSNKNSPELYNRFRDSSGFGNWKKIAHIGDPLPSYTVATLPSPSPAGQVVYVSDEVDGAVLAFSNGNNWRRVTDRAVVTAA